MAAVIPMREALRLLWVDDEEDFLRHAAVLCGFYGFSVTPAPDARQALTILADRSFDLLLVDLRLGGGMNGLDLAAKIRERDRDIPIFIFSGYVDEPYYSGKIDRLQLSGIIRKPIPVGKTARREMFLKLEMACEAADTARLRRKYGRELVDNLASQAVGLRCFVMTPFGPQFDAIYEDVIASAISRRGIMCKRADEVYGTASIIEDIERSIVEADFLVAELTDRNPNVLYELGLAHAMKKPVILISQAIEDIPFDLKHRRCIIYSADHRGIRQLEEDLAKTVDAVIRSLPPKVAGT